jgi:hypothetical protein
MLSCPLGNGSSEVSVITLFRPYAFLLAGLRTRSHPRPREHKRHHTIFPSNPPKSHPAIPPVRQDTAYDCPELSLRVRAGRRTASTHARINSTPGPLEYRPKVSPGLLCPTTAAMTFSGCPACSAFDMNHRLQLWKFTMALRLPPSSAPRTFLR